MAAIDSLETVRLVCVDLGNPEEQYSEPGPNLLGLTCLDSLDQDRILEFYRLLPPAEPEEVLLEAEILKRCIKEETSGVYEG